MPAAQDDEVGSGDRLKVTFAGNADLSGEFRVQSDGAITLPVLGPFAVSGKTAADISKMIAARFAQNARSAGSNNVVVDVIEWRPVFVTGTVSKPGAYPFMPGMTVLHAVSQSGGFYRIADGDISTFINVAQNMSRIQEVRQQLAHNLIQVASLTAEKAGSSELKPPKLLQDMASQEGIKELLEAERRALSLRLQAAANDMDVRRRQIESTRRELEGYRKQLRSVTAQLESEREHLSELVSALAKRVVKRADVLVVETFVNKLNADFRDLSAHCGRTERELARAEQDFADLPLLRQIKIEGEVSALRQKIASDRAAYQGAQFIVGQLSHEGMLLTSGGSEPKRVFAIMRKHGGKPIFTAAGLESRLHPGDVIMVGGHKPGDGAILSTGGIQVEPERQPLSNVSVTSASGE